MAAVPAEAAHREGRVAWGARVRTLRSDVEASISRSAIRPGYGRVWYEDVVLAETDPWWGATDKPFAHAIKERRSANLESPSVQGGAIWTELASAEGLSSRCSGRR